MKKPHADLPEAVGEADEPRDGASRAPSRELGTVGEMPHQGH